MSLRRRLELEPIGRWVAMGLLGGAAVLSLVALTLPSVVTVACPVCAPGQPCPASCTAAFSPNPWELPLLVLATASVAGAIVLLAFRRRADA